MCARNVPRSTAYRSGALGQALLALCVCCVWLACGSARADLLLPAGHGVFTGLSGGSSRAFESEVGKHPAVEGVFVTWGRRFESAFGQASFNHSRLMLHISTAQGYGAPEQITLRAIAEGAGDGYLLSLSARIVQSGAPVYIRLFPEMDNANNAYCAFNQDGSSRGASHSLASFRAAWRRVVLIVRGGPVAAIDTRLRALGLPPVRGTSAAALAHPRVAFLWVPQTAGSPDTPANSAQAYYPGDAYVDWVGTDFYSRFPNFSGLQRFYSEHPGKPFAFGEWALWGGDSPEWVNQLFSFMSTHHQVHMALYNQGERPNGPFRLTQYPSARRAIGQRLASSRFLAYAPEWEVVARARRSVGVARQSSTGESETNLRATRRTSNAASGSAQLLYSAPGGERPEAPVASQPLRPPGKRQLRSTIRKRLPSWSRKKNIGGTGPPIRMTCSSASTPRASRSERSASASSVVKPTWVSIPVGSPSRGGMSAIVVAAPGGATSSQRSPCPNGMSVRFSNPSLSR
jgi:hypothetical protein